MKKPTLTTLPNGVRLLTIADSSAATATVLVLVGTGSNYESETQNGLAHFLEHMYFKGTKKLPSSKDIVEQFDRIGALSNAFTSNEYTGYYAKGSPKHVPTFIRILSDIYCNSTFPEAEIEKEKGVIIEEINMYEDMPQYNVAEILARALYGDQPAGRPITGTRETVRSFTRGDFLAYKQLHYHGANTVVVVAGSVDPVDVRVRVKAAFGAIDALKAAPKKKTVVKKSGVQLSLREKVSDQAHLAIGFHSIPLGHSDAAAVTLLATVLGRGMSSRLFQELRESLGVAYYVGATQESSTDHGVFEITAGIDKRRVNEVLARIAHILADLKKNFLDPAELTKAREYTLGISRLGLESSDDIAGFYGIQLLTKGTFKTLPELIREYRAVTPADIRRVARKLFTPSNTYLALVGPFGKGDIDDSPFGDL